MAAEWVQSMGARMRARRLELDLTQREVAARLPGEVDAQQVSKWERGRHKPNDATIEHLAAALETTVPALMADQPKAGTPDLMRSLGDGENELRRIEAKLDALLDHFGIKPETIEEIVTDAADDLGLPAGNEDDGQTAAKPRRRRRRAA